MSVALDSSAALAWAYVEEKTPAIEELMVLIERQGAWVPSLWKLELANSLQMSVRKGRHDAAKRDAILFRFNELPIRTDIETDNRAWSSTLKLAVAYKLTLYDASYMELALRRSLPLATLDRQLRSAAQAEGVSLLGL